MYRCYKLLAPTVIRTLKPVALQQRNFWAFPRPSDFRIMLRDIDRQMDNFDREIQSVFRNGSSLLPRTLSLPVIETAGNTYRINVDVSGFKPEDIKLSLKERLLSVEAKMEHKTDDGSRYYQEMSRAYTIPEHVDVAGLKCTISSEGIMAIEAPLTETAPKPQEIPITRTEEIAAK